MEIKGRNDKDEGKICEGEGEEKYACVEGGIVLKGEKERMKIKKGLCGKMKERSVKKE